MLFVFQLSFFPSRFKPPPPPTPPSPVGKCNTTQRNDRASLSNVPFGLARYRYQTHSENRGHIPVRQQVISFIVLHPAGSPPPPFGAKATIRSGGYTFILEPLLFLTSLANSSDTKLKMVWLINTLSSYIAMQHIPAISFDFLLPPPQ